MNTAILEILVVSLLREKSGPQCKQHFCAQYIYTNQYGSHSLAFLCIIIALNSIYCLFENLFQHIQLRYQQFNAIRVFWLQFLAMTSSITSFKTTNKRWCKNLKY